MLFSWPGRESEGGGDDDDVVEFPESEVLLKTRFTGLLGDKRVARDIGFADAAFGFPDRKESLTPDLNGVDRPAWVY